MKYLEIKRFFGIDQSTDENLLPVGNSPFAYNMDTTDGSLSVAKGFVKHISTPLPGKASISKISAFHGLSGLEFIVLSGSGVYAFKNGAWEGIHSYSGATRSISHSTLEASIDGIPILLMTDGSGIVKYNGTEVTPFGSAAQNSDKRVLYIEMYRNRLFAAGDTDFKSRLYYSKLPGGTRTIEDWGADTASPSVEGGHIEIGGNGADAIIGLVALSNELIILKEHSIYRLIGDRPSNFVVEPIEADMYKTIYTSIIKHGGTAYFLTPSGLCVYDGVTVRLMNDASKIRKILENTNIDTVKAARTRTKLYFAIKYGAEDAIVIYDLVNRTYMLRNGFSIGDIVGIEDALYFINEKRYVYKFDIGDNYDGEPIASYWRTPTTDLNQKSTIKSLKELYLRGEGKNDARLIITARAGDSVTILGKLLPRDSGEVLEIPLKNEGRTLSLAFENEAGGRFIISGGIELAITLRGRTV
ncbi:MAG: hypothetical protein RRY79_00210 [Clostridia bacterium]